MSTKRNPPGGDRRASQTRHTATDAIRTSQYKSKRLDTQGAPAELRSLKAERTVLGAVMNEPALLAVLRRMLKPEDFGYTPHRYVFEAMCTRAESGLPVDDDELLANDLQARGLSRDDALAVVSPLAYTAFDTYWQAPQYCREVLKYALKAARHQIAQWNADTLAPDADEDAIAAGSASALARIADIERRRRMGDDEATGALAPGEIAGTISARDLLAKTFPAPVWIVRGLITQGLTAVSGKPKMGKSWLLLALALARAGGGNFLSSLTLDPGPVLYLALEDTEESLQERLRIVLQGANAPEALTLATSAQMADWHMNNGGIERIGGWLEAHPGGCVIVDTLAKIKPAHRGNGDAYAEDYAVGARLKAAADAHNGAVIIVTHNRKAKAEDPLDEINATTGLMGAFDTGLVMRRTRGEADAVLYSTGRRVRDAELALRFDADSCFWSLMGDASKYATSKERAEILQAIEELVQATGRPAQRKQTAEAVQKPSSNVGYLLTQMTNAQQVIARDGGYLLSTPNSPNTPNTTTDACVKG
ncbi:MAG TPA: AAA family ATPase [Ktedonobacterales bacterium]|nr:AAA family ATPase [Ktedonobacterales bacterium]